MAGAIDEALKPMVRRLAPWKINDIKYLELARGNPLATNFNRSGRTKKKQNVRRQNKRRSGFFFKKKLKEASYDMSSISYILGRYFLGSRWRCESSLMKSGVGLGNLLLHCLSRSMINMSDTQ